MRIIKTCNKSKTWVSFVCPCCSLITFRKYYNAMELRYQEIKCQKCGTEFEASIIRNSLKKVKKYEDESRSKDC